VRAAFCLLRGDNILAKTHHFDGFWVHIALHLVLTIQPFYVFVRMEDAKCNGVVGSLSDSTGDHLRNKTALTRRNPAE
jgi:hypothetical protein